MGSYDKVFNMPFAKVYPLLVAKVERKGASQADVDAAIGWLLGYSASEIAALAASEATYREAFEGAPALNLERDAVTGVVCGVRVEEVDDPLMRDMRRLDKMIDNIAKGRPAVKR